MGKMSRSRMGPRLPPAASKDVVTRRSSALFFDADQDDFGLPFVVFAVVGKIDLFDDAALAGEVDVAAAGAFLELEAGVGGVGLAVAEGDLHLLQDHVAFLDFE